jgi:hypothetical protein
MVGFLLWEMLENYPGSLGTQFGFTMTEEVEISGESRGKFQLRGKTAMRGNRW